MTKNRCMIKKEETDRFYHQSVYDLLQFAALTYTKDQKMAEQIAADSYSEAYERIGKTMKQDENRIILAEIVSRIAIDYLKDNIFSRSARRLQA